MIFFKLAFSGLLIGALLQAYPQKTISGIVLDAENSAPLTYVNIGIRNKNLGTASDENGKFTLTIPTELVTEELTFSLVGYQELTFPIDTFHSSKQVIRLHERVSQLNEVEISAERLVERKFGIKRRNLLIHFTDGMFLDHDVFEIGQTIKLKGPKAQITSVNLYLFDNGKDSVSFRINFYDLEDGRPSKRLIHKQIIQRHAVKEGWLRLDISSESVVLKDNFIVTLEILPDKDEDKTPLSYEVKLGGGSRSFYRKNSLGSWGTPLHHYCMYITALVDKSLPEEPDEIETLPTRSTWSEHVQDSFRIFLRLPSDYEKQKGKTYPVIYCLDANAYFDHLGQIVSGLDHKNKLKTEPIIVGIGYDNAYVMDSLRVRDYTYPNALPSDSLIISGGGKSFYHFLKSELVPNIDNTYRTDTTNRTILGHSFGGYFVGYSLLRDLSGDQVFKNYVSASPSLWYHDWYLLKQFQSLPSEMEYPKKRFFLTIGEEEMSHGNEEYFKTFMQSLQDIPSIKLESKVYPKLDHLGAAIPAFEDAIEGLFGDGGL